MKEAAAHVNLAQQFGVDPLRQRLASADDECFEFRILPDKLGQPLDLNRDRLLVVRCLELGEVGFAFGEAREGCTRVAEHDPARAEGVQQGVDQRLALGRTAGLRLFAKGADPFGFRAKKGGVRL